MDLEKGILLRKPIHVGHTIRRQRPRIPRVDQDIDDVEGRIPRGGENLQWIPWIGDRSPGPLETQRGVRRRDNPHLQHQPVGRQRIVERDDGRALEDRRLLDKGPVGVVHLAEERQRHKRHDPGPDHATADPSPKVQRQTPHPDKYQDQQREQQRLLDVDHRANSRSPCPVAENQVQDKAVDVEAVEGVDLAVQVDQGAQQARNGNLHGCRRAPPARQGQRQIEQQIGNQGDQCRLRKARGDKIGPAPEIHITRLLAPKQVEKKLHGQHTDRQQIIDEPFEGPFLAWCGHKM